jgi:hypothetical protein
MYTHADTPILQVMAIFYCAGHSINPELRIICKGQRSEIKSAGIDMIVYKSSLPVVKICRIW